MAENVVIVLRPTPVGHSAFTFRNFLHRCLCAINIDDQLTEIAAFILYRNSSPNSFPYFLSAFSELVKYCAMTRG